MSKINEHNPFYCILIYRHPGPASGFLSDFTELLTSIIKLDKVLIIGDFNIHIDDQSSNTATELLNITESFNSVPHVSGPTHSKGHTLDLVFSHGLMVENLHVEDSLVSDHSCVSFDMAYVEKHPSCTIQQKKHFINQSVVDSFILLFDAESAPNNDDDDNDVNSLVQCFNLRCKSVLDKVAPNKSRSASLRKPCPWISEEIKNHRRSCRKAERLWKASKLEVHRLYLKDL